MRCRASEQMRSERIGFRLYAIAEDPICVDSNGSSTSCVLKNKIKNNARVGWWEGAVEGGFVGVRYLKMGEEAQVCRDFVRRRAE